MDGAWIRQWLQSQFQWVYFNFMYVTPFAPLSKILVALVGMAWNKEQRPNKTKPLVSTYRSGINIIVFTYV